MMMFIPHIVPGFCTSYYSVFCVPYMVLLQPFSSVFSLKGIAYQPMGTDIYNYACRYNINKHECDMQLCAYI